MMSDKIISETNIFYWFAAKRSLFNIILFKFSLLSIYEMIMLRKCL